MSFGCPVVASNSKSLKESCKICLFDPTNLSEISENIIKAINSINDKNISQGITHAKKFTWNKCAEETLNFYEN